MLLCAVFVGCSVPETLEDRDIERWYNDPPLESLSEDAFRLQVNDEAPACVPFLGRRTGDADNPYPAHVGLLEEGTLRLVEAADRVGSASRYRPATAWERYDTFEAAWDGLRGTASDAVAACAEFPAWVPHLIARHLAETFEQVVVPVREVCADIGSAWGSSESSGACRDAGKSVECLWMLCR